MNTTYVDPRPPLKPGDWIRKCYDYEHPKPGCGGDFNGRAHSPMLNRPQQVRAVNADGSVQCDLRGPDDPATYTVRKFIRAEGPQADRFPRLCSDGKLLVAYLKAILLNPKRARVLAAEAIAKVEASQYPGLGT